MSWLALSPSMLFAFALTSVVIELTPGPNMGYLAVLSATEGRRSGFAATAGIALGLLIVGIAAALGLAAVISASPVLYQALRWAGILFLLWLAWEGWNEATENSPGKTDGENEHAKYFTRGLVTNLLNPKAGLFYVAVLPGFVDPALPIVGQTILLSIVYVSIATAIHATIVGLAGTATLLLQNPIRNKLVRRIMSAVLACIAIWFGWSTRI